MENIVQIGLNIGIYKKYTYLISYLVEIILKISYSEETYPKWWKYNGRRKKRRY